MQNDATAEDFQPQEGARPEAQPQGDELATPERIEQVVPGIEAELKKMDLGSIKGELQHLNEAIDRGDQVGMLRWAEKLDKTIFISGLRKFWDHLVPNFMQKILYNTPMCPLRPLVDAGFLEMGGMTPQQFDEKLATGDAIKKGAIKFFAPEFGPLVKACEALNQRQTNMRHLLIKARYSREADEAKHEHGHSKGGVGGAANLDA
ncbi:MAG: hypothetical protein AAB606_04490 [Patescibacteria group bacterium]